MSLFDEQEVTRRLEAGIKVSYEHSPREWKNTAYQQVVYLARTLDEFTTDEVIERLELVGADQANLMALGAVMRKAAANNVIRNSGRRQRTKIPRRHRELTVWTSIV